MAGDILPPSPSGHLGQHNLCQKSLVDPACWSSGFVLINVHTEVNIGELPKVPEQLGQDKTKGSQPRYLQFTHSTKIK